MASGGVSPAPGMANGIHSTDTELPLSKLNPEHVSQKIKICVFCGASPGKSPAHMEAARELARVMHENNISLVYGGGTVGLMGEVARTLVSLSGPTSVHGIIPAPLVKYERGPDSSSASDDLPNPTLYGKTTVVADMHTRKKMMAQEVLDGAPGSGFVALSGGYGTLEELMEVVTWNQLGIHNRGVVVLNIEGYWNGLLAWVDGAVKAGFVNENSSAIIQEATNGKQVVDELRDYKNASGRFKLEWGTE
ncbi:hypothetical protein BJ878DRAFT_541414 [Calycina marina]|uniref:Cytokinin riboside 5'-monophosphate phosphoribohydrolase n=1 Tax=Calycina marina TaxID=1763456 RepID=A0A9P7Z4V0_9HELO|nr:hypothetical protein BJ878DRAFT_541414 [Calycina marina]